MPQIDEESLLFDGWKLSDVIESDIYSKTYRAVRKDEDGKSEYAAIRHYSVSETDLAKRFKDKSRLKQYCHQLKKQLVNGLEIQKRFNDEIYVVRCYEYEIKEKTDCVGFDLYARFELLNSLQELIRADGLTEKSVGYIAADISGAIKVLSLDYVVHGDIRPANIYYCADDGFYKLGNFEAASEGSIMPDAVRPNGAYLYMAPEVYRKELADTSSDLYSLGIMIYRFLNGNCIPFTVPGPQSITEKSMKAAFQRRMEGEPLPPPLFAENHISEILRKVCDADESLRYQDAGELQDAFLDGFFIRNSYGNRQAFQDDTILPFGEKENEGKSAGAEMESADGRETARTSEKPENDTNTSRKKAKKLWQTGAIAAVILLLCICAAAAEYHFWSETGSDSKTGQNYASADSDDLISCNDSQNEGNVHKTKTRTERAAYWAAYQMFLDLSGEMDKTANYHPEYSVSESEQKAAELVARAETEGWSEVKCEWHNNGILDKYVIVHAVFTSEEFGDRITIDWPGGWDTEWEDTYYTYEKLE